VHGAARGVGVGGDDVDVAQGERPMEGLMGRARSGEFPLYTFCAFEVLEKCPDERSGPNFENCPSCPLVEYCHDVPDGVLPKAKRSNGHYAIDALIQKVHCTSTKTFESDYLCKGPRSDGLWFPAFDVASHVGVIAEYDKSLPVHVAVDSGVFTGAVFSRWRGTPPRPCRSRRSGSSPTTSRRTGRRSRTLARSWNWPGPTARGGSTRSRPTRRGAPETPSARR